ncbi:cellulase family glycosylhydrolase [Candidatus Aciduliprofundum boonei]|uniref:Glycoside hydrolase family 5 n=1 Tax=Aciduliprofundum boonei (strain DSM 19572 / T469) TaxID=439481 RepID=D3TB00_ACIB4|nr:glycoside hydrolase family 5 [Aciduliprofundum boonei T469]
MILTINHHGVWIILVLLLVVDISMFGVYSSHSVFSNARIESLNGTEPINATEYQKLMGIGINVDWMTFKKVNTQYFQWREQGVHVPSYFKERGFSNVRIRVNQDLTTNQTAMEQLTDIVNDCLDAGLYPIITNVADDLRDYPTNISVQQHFVKWWETVIDHFKGYSYNLSYDLLIESSHEIKNYPDVLNKVYYEIIHYLRQEDPYRIVFVTPAGGSKPDYLQDLNVTNNGYILAEWHIYAGGPSESGTDCVYSKSYINQTLSTALSWTKETGIPTWQGAWRSNCYPNGGTDAECNMSLEINFTKAMVSAYAGANLPYDVNADTKFFDISNLTWYKLQEEALDIILQQNGAVPEFSMDSPWVILVIIILIIAVVYPRSKNSNF